MRRLALLLTPLPFLAIVGLAWMIGRTPRSQGADLEAMAGRVTAGGHVTATAFAVAPGLVITNAHVTMRCVVANLPLVVAGQSGWSMVAQDPTMDLSLLAGPAGDIPALALSAAPQLPHGTPVMLLGYPLADDGAPGPMRLTPGQIERSALTVHRPDIGKSISFIVAGPSGAAIDPRWADGVAYFGAGSEDRLRWILQIAAPTGHGDSGGPVVDGDGHVVGVIFAGSPIAGQTSAVTLDDLRDFMLRAGVTPLFAPPASGVSDWQQAITRTTPSVVRIGC